MRYLGTHARLSVVVFVLVGAIVASAGCGPFDTTAGDAYAGTWEGTYDGLTDSGTFTLEIPAAGRVQFRGQSNLGSYAGTFQGEGTCSSTGHVKAEASISAVIATVYKVTIEGNLAPSGTGSGTFHSSTILGVPIGSGSFTVHRASSEG